MIDPILAPHPSLTQSSYLVHDDEALFVHAAGHGNRAAHGRAVELFLELAFRPHVGRVELQHFVPTIDRRVYGSDKGLGMPV